MSKKAMSFLFGALITGILALIVLFVLGAMFSFGASDIFSKFMGIANAGEAQARGDSCAIYGSRYCSAANCNHGYRTVGCTWSDCPPKDNSGKSRRGSYTCCEKIEQQSVQPGSAKKV